MSTEDFFSPSSKNGLYRPRGPGNTIGSLVKAEKLVYVVVVVICFSSFVDLLLLKKNNLYTRNSYLRGIAQQAVGNVHFQPNYIPYVFHTHMNACTHAYTHTQIHAHAHTQ